MPVYENVTMPEFEKGRETCRTIVLPCGSIEEHGPHLPLGTDTFSAVAVARAGAGRGGFWVAPPVYYGLCRSSSDHPGTLTIRGETLKALVLDIVRSLHAQGMRQVILLSGHAGGTHMAALTDAGEQLLLEFADLRVAVLTVSDLGATVWGDVLETPRDSHAGEIETSLMLEACPELVHGTAEEEYPTFPRFILVRNKRRFWPGGVWGNPKAASVEKGRIFLDRAGEALAELARQLEAWDES